MDFEIESHHPFATNKFETKSLKDTSNDTEENVSFYVEAPCTVPLLGVESSAFGYPNLRAFVNEKIKLGVVVVNSDKEINVRCTCKKRSRVDPSLWIPCLEMLYLLNGSIS